MNRTLGLMILFVILSSLLAIGACRKGGDDSIADDDDTNASDCADNSAPELTAAVIYVDGVAAGDNPSFMEGQSVQIYLTFNDADCNLGGGSIDYTLDTTAQTQSETIANDVSCNGNAADQVLGFAFTASGIGAHVLNLMLTDQCGDRSGQLALQFTLTENTIDDDNDTSPTDDDDDTSPPATLLTGEISYYGDAVDLSGRMIRMYLWPNWLPGQTEPTAATNTTVPITGFPFSYKWNLDDYSVPAGAYFLFAFLDQEDGDGFINFTVDPVYSPLLPFDIALEQTTTFNFALVQPTSEK